MPNPESVNELYDLAGDPDELTNVYDDLSYSAARDALLPRLHGALRHRGDDFHHRMRACTPVGGDSGDSYDASLSEFEPARQESRGSRP